jgi:hypothetical protein
MNYTLLYIAFHLAGIMGYQFYGQDYYLILSCLPIAYALFQYVKVSILVLSPAWDVELSYADHIPTNWKFLHNAVMALSTYLIFSAGYQFFAGIISLYIFVVVGSLLITSSGVNLGDEE